MIATDPTRAAISQGAVSTRRSRRSVSAAIGAIGAICALAAPSPLRAQTIDGESSRLFDEGKALLAQNDWAGACAKFEASKKLDPSVSTQIKIARCRGHEGKHVAAWNDFLLARELNSATARTAERKREVEALLEEEFTALAPKVGRLTLSTPRAPAGLIVIVDGAVVSRFGVPLAYESGRLEVVAEAPTCTTMRRTFSMEPAKAESLVVQLECPNGASAPLEAEAPGVSAPPKTATSAPPAAPPLQPSTPTPPRGLGTQRAVGLVFGGMGFVGLAVAGVFGLKTRAAVAEARPFCDASWRCDRTGLASLADAGRAQTAAITLAVLGSASLTTGVVLFATGGPAPKSPRTGRVWLGANPGGLHAGGVF